MVNFEHLKSEDRLTSLTATRDYIVEALKEEGLPATGKAALVKQLLEVNNLLTAAGNSSKRSEVNDIINRRKARKQAKGND